MIDIIPKKVMKYKLYIIYSSIAFAQDKTALTNN